MPDRAAYVERCQARWHSWALKDARANWSHWVEMHDSLKETIVIPYLRDPWAKDLAGKCHNPNGTLSCYCWMMADAFAKEKGMLGSLLDFNEDSQTVFLRRGLVFYLALMIAEIEAAAKTDPAPTLNL